MKKVLSFLTVLSLFNSSFAEETSLLENREWLKKHLVSVQDFPQPGFKFITHANLLKDPEAFHRAIKEFADRYRDKKLNAIAGLDARGFIFGAALAYELKLPFIMVRKAGKLPRASKRIDYSLEYGVASFEVELESVKKDDRILVIDDVLATGGTAEAASKLLESLGAVVVENAFLIELTFLKARERMTHPVFALISLYDGV